jgi:CheY-like chemotaxis protein
MNGIDDLRDELDAALHHLYDPGYEPPALLALVLGCDKQAGGGSVQSRVLQAIDVLKPSEATPQTTHRLRAYEVLHSRFVQRLTQEHAAEALHWSVRTLQRTQREAIHTLALELWQACALDTASPATAEPVAAEEKVAPPDGDWRSQTEVELASLRASAPHSTTDVIDMLQDLLALEHVLTARSGVHLQIANVQPGLVAAVHPSALQQTLIAAIGRMARKMSAGPISIFAGLAEGEVKLTLTARLDEPDELLLDTGLRDILVPEGGSLTASLEGDRIFLEVRVPTLGEITVLVVDDNLDMIHFYRRSTAGTRYRIVEATSGMKALGMISQQQPDLIILDVMLPDIDGWKLLIQLHEDPATRRIPVIICTVIREEDLAYSLGASYFLAKPVEPRKLVEALDRVRSQASAAALKAPRNSARAN